MTDAVDGSLLDSSDIFQQLKECHDSKKTGSSLYSFFEQLFHPASCMPQTLLFDPNTEIQLLSRLMQPISNQPTLSLYAQKVVSALAKVWEATDQKEGIADEAKLEEKRLAAVQAEMKLASLLFAAQRNPELAHSAAAGKNGTVDLKNLRESLLLEAGKAPKKNGISHSVAKIQDDAVVLSLNWPREIAKMVLSNEGILNVGLIPILQKRYIPTNRPLVDWELKLDQALKALNASWQEILDAIQNPAPISINLIRAELGLSLSVPVTDLHAKQVALAAFFTQPSLPTKDARKQSADLKETLRDYGALLCKGYLTEEHNGTRENYFFLPMLDDPDLQKPISLESHGWISGTTLPIWNAPSIQAACRAMGIDNPAELRKQLLPSLANQTLTSREIIRLFAPFGTAADPIASGLYGFSATQNRLVAAFQDARASIISPKRVAYSIQQAFAPTWKDFAGTRSRRQKGELDKFMETFAGLLGERIRLVHQGTSDILFGKEAAQTDQIGTPLQDRESLKSFLKTILDLAATATQSSRYPMLGAESAAVLTKALDQSSFPYESILQAVRLR